MSRKPIVIDTGSETVNVRVDIPKNVWALMIDVGRRQAQRLMPRARFTDERVGVIGAGVLMERLGELAARGSVEQTFGPDFEKARLKLTDGNLGVAAVDGIKIDINRLHRNPKMKSGFQGVYASGIGFRAMGKDFADKHVVIGTYQTAEEAAYRRWEHFKRNGLPYGELEEEIERWRSDPHIGGFDIAYKTDAEVAQEIEEHMRGVGTWESVFGSKCVTMRPRVSKLPTREAALSKVVPVPATPPEELEDSGGGEPEDAADQTPFGFDPDDLPESLR